VAFLILFENGTIIEPYLLLKMSMALLSLDDYDVAKSKGSQLLVEYSVLPAKQVGAREIVNFRQFSKDMQADSRI
jgi:hypothetical protein